jgi:hypothetical protein
MKLDVSMQYYTFALDEASQDLCTIVTPFGKYKSYPWEYCYFMKLDVSMQYYTFALDEASQDLCTIVTPFGKHKYKSLPMGVCQSPDFAHAAMEAMLHGLDNVVVNIDDIKITHMDWNEHLQCIEQVLHHLHLFAGTTSCLAMLELVVCINPFWLISFILVSKSSVRVLFKSVNHASISSCLVLEEGICHPRI